MEEFNVQKFKLKSREDKLNYFIDYCMTGPDEHIEFKDHMIHISPAHAQMILIMQGLKSKKSRIIKKVLKRHINKMLLDSIKSSMAEPCLL